MKKFEEQVNSRIDKVEHNLDKYRSEIVEFKDEVIGEIRICNSIKNSDMQISNPPSPNKVVSQATKEIQSRVERRNNLLVFNVPESESNMKNQVVIDDTNIFLELCNIVEAGV
jgi:hypothetical protein